MPILDFKELSISRAGSPPGEDLEALARELGRRLGLEPEWSGRGADQGRDLFFTERRTGALGSENVRWLVSCKDFARSGRSVSEGDVGSVSDKLAQHRADAFLLVTTTTASTGLKAVLDGMHAGGAAKTQVWDRHELERLLLQHAHLDLVRRYLPLSHEAFHRLGSLPQALRTLEALVPGPVHARIRRVVEAYQAEDAWITGELIWPYDRASANTIDRVLSALLENGDAAAAAGHLLDGDIEFDAFEATLRTLATLRPDEARELCRHLIGAKAANGPSLFAYRFYVDTYEPGADEQIALAADLPTEDVVELYAEEIDCFISDELRSGLTSYRVWDDLDSLSNRTSVEEAYVEELSIAPEADSLRIEFQAALTFRVSLSYDREGSDTSSSFPGRLAGHIDARGIFVDEITVDTTSFYKGPST